MFILVASGFFWISGGKQFWLELKFRLTTQTNLKLAWLSALKFILEQPSHILKEPKFGIVL